MPVRTSVAVKNDFQPARIVDRVEVDARGNDVAQRIEIQQLEIVRGKQPLQVIHKEMLGETSRL